MSTAIATASILGVRTRAATPIGRVRTNGRVHPAPRRALGPAVAIALAATVLAAAAAGLLEGGRETPATDQVAVPRPAGAVSVDRAPASAWS